SHAASTISARVASRRSSRRFLVVSPNTVRNYERCSEHCQPGTDEFFLARWSKLADHPCTRWRSPMAKRDGSPTGAPCWIDLMSADPDKSAAFYGELFGWTAESTGDEYGG